MAATKLVLDNFEVDTFYLCAIHANMPSYKMAFLLNRHLGLGFSRAESDVEVYSLEHTEIYPRYIFEDTINYNTFTLIKNKCIVKKSLNTKTSNLFINDSSQEIVKNLIPQYKNVDYIVKIETDSESYPLKLLVSNIINITQVITAFEVNYQTIKTKTNLIFE